jgi:hypothetical protein
MDALPDSVGRHAFTGFDMTDDKVGDGVYRHIALELKHVFEGMVAEADEVNQECFLAMDLEHALENLMVNPCKSNLDHLLKVSPALIETVGLMSKVLGNPMGCLSTPPVISEGKWIEANARLIREMGPEAYLRQLLNMLKEPV